MPATGQSHSEPLPPQPPAGLSERTQALRSFSRFYTRRIGVLDEHLLRSRFSLAESRVLWELAHDPGLTASDLTDRLQHDAGYLSRLLTGLRQQGLLQARPSAEDARRQLLRLTAAGRRAFNVLDRRSHAQASAMLSALPEAEQCELAAATGRIVALLEPAARPPVAIRPMRPGDLGWIVAAHGRLYAAEYGFDARFEASVARIAADFVDRLQPGREQAWIAEQGGVAAGCVMLVQARRDDDGRRLPGVAQLRLLLIEPSARGQGLGQRLVQTCEQAAVDADYRRMRLWTNSVLTAARRLYAAAGWVLVQAQPHRSYGQALVGEIWEKDLRT